jgi:hypothetical protein
MQFGGVIATLRMRHLQNLVASIRKPLQGLVNFLTHFLRDYQLALN